jgi:hypothetical protein
MAKRSKQEGRVMFLLKVFVLITATASVAYAQAKRISTLAAGTNPRQIQFGLRLNF